MQYFVKICFVPFGKSTISYFDLSICSRRANSAFSASSYNLISSSSSLVSFLAFLGGILNL